MKEPEKLYVDYVDTEDRLSDSILYGFTEKRRDDDIEYVNKNVFIEKALKWMIMKECIDSVLSVEMIDEVQKYMEE